MSTMSTMNATYVVDLTWTGPVERFGRPPVTRTITETVTIFRAKSAVDAARLAEIRTGKNAIAVKIYEYGASKGLIVWMSCPPTSN